LVMIEALEVFDGFLPLQGGVMDDQVFRLNGRPRDQVGVRQRGPVRHRGWLWAVVVTLHPFGQRLKRWRRSWRARSRPPPPRVEGDDLGTRS
jgi:hypothetical protein